MIYVKNFNRFSFINAFKAIIASLFGYILGHALGWWLGVDQMYTWIVITILVVMSSQPNLGGALEKAKMRLLGTIMGSIMAIIILFIFPHNSWLQVIFALILIFIGVYIATASSKFMYAGVLGCVTVSIILFSKEVTLIIAFFRTLEVILGVLIAIIINRFIFPIRASDRLYFSFSETLLLLKTLHERLIKKIDYDEVLVKVFMQFTKQLSLYKEISNEKDKVNLDYYKILTSQLRQLYRYNAVIYDYITLYPAKKIRFSNSIEFNDIHAAISELMSKMALDFKNKKSNCYQSSFNIIEKKLEDFKNTMRVDPKYRHVNTLVFSLEKNIEIFKTIQNTVLDIK